MSLHSVVPLANALGLSVRATRRMCLEGKIPAVYIARRWIITDWDAALAAGLARRTQRGPPVGKIRAKWDAIRAARAAAAALAADVAAATGEPPAVSAPDPADPAGEFNDFASHKLQYRRTE